MKLKINKACDLSSISVLPPQSRRSSGVSSGLDSSLVLGRSQMASQLRPQQSQLTFSQGASQFSQFSQNSQDEILTIEKDGSQERESSARRTSFLPPIKYSREDSQMVVSRTSNNAIRKWSGQEYKCHISEELEHRIGMIETSLSRFGMILDSVQSDIMLANKGTKELALETKDVRQKLNAHDDSLQLMNKGQEDLKICLDMGLKTLSEQLKQNLNQESSGQIISSLSALSEQLKQILNQENSAQIISSLSALPEKIGTQMVKLQNGLHKVFLNEIKEISFNLKTSTQKQATPSLKGPKAVLSATTVSCQASPLDVQFPKNATRHLKSRQKSIAPKIEMGGWTSVKPELAIPKVGNVNQRSNKRKLSPDQLECRVVIESDEEIDGGFLCLLEEKRTEVDKYSAEDVEQETARILRKARRRKRKYCNTIIIN